MKKSSQRVFDLINKDNKLEKNPISADIVRLGNPKVNTNKDIPRNTEILLTALPGQRVKGSDVSGMIVLISVRYLLHLPPYVLLRTVLTPVQT